jgi:small subunit ribosomal protein S4e
MARKGKARHLKKIAVPRAWAVARKSKGVFAKKPLPGKHSLKESIPVGILLRDILKIAETMVQAKKLLRDQEVLVDGVPVKMEGVAVGLMDIVSVPKLKKNYRMLFVGKHLVPVEIGEEETRVKLCKIVGKTIVGKDRIQLNFHDGRSYLIEREEDVFKTGDTIKLAVPKQELKGFLKLEKGATCYIWKGRHAGEIGLLEEIMERAGSKESDARLKSREKELITLKSYLFVVDKEFKTVG